MFDKLDIVLVLVSLFAVIDGRTIDASIDVAASIIQRAERLLLHRQEAEFVFSICDRLIHHEEYQYDSVKDRKCLTKPF